MSDRSLRLVLLALVATGVVVAGGTLLLGPPQSGYYVSATPVDDPDGTVYEIEELDVNEREIVRRAIESDERPFTSSPPSGAVGEYVRHEGTVYEIMATGRFGSSEPSYLVPLFGGSILAVCGAVGLTVSTVLDRRRSRS